MSTPTEPNGSLRRQDERSRGRDSWKQIKRKLAFYTAARPIRAEAKQPGLCIARLGGYALASEESEFDGESLIDLRKN